MPQSTSLVVLPLLTPGDGVPRGIRTPDLALRRRLLYPAELSGRGSRSLGRACSSPPKTVEPLGHSVSCGFP